MKKAIVTGASSGIGKAICKQLAAKGWVVYGIGRSFQKSDDTTGIEHIVCDITDTAKLTKKIKEINKNHDISLLINNAGVGFYALHEELNPVKISQMVRTNLEAPMIITNLLLRDLKKNKGTIINISSITAEKTNPHGCAYGATKAGLTSFSHSLFEEARKYGVRVVNLEPDMTDTKLYRNADFTVDQNEAARLQPVEVADAVIYVLEQREGLVMTDITIRPQLHRIARK
jgi:NADP-dependent 3-hydroxy acid dehydrogenase YdfG